MCGPGMSAGAKQVEMECFGLLLLVAGGLDVVAACPLDSLCGTIAVLPMGKGHKKMLNAVKWQSWDFNQGLASLPKFGFHTAW